VDSSQPLFSQTSVSRDTKTENAFQSDLNKAIELQKRGNFLKKSNKNVLKNTSSKEESLDLSEHRISAAFDMNFDEVAPINETNGTSNLKKPKHIVAENSVDLDNDPESPGKASGRKQSNSKRKKSSSKEKARSSSLMKRVTPGGSPTPGGPDDDEENVPPAPAPPVNGQMSQEEAEAAYDLL